MTPKKMGPYLEDEEISMDERTALGVQDGHGCGGGGHGSATRGEEGEEGVASRWVVAGRGAVWEEVKEGTGGETREVDGYEAGVMNAIGRGRGTLEGEGSGGAGGDERWEKPGKGFFQTFSQPVLGSEAGRPPRQADSPFAPPPLVGPRGRSTFNVQVAAVSRPPERTRGRPPLITPCDPAHKE